MPIFASDMLSSVAYAPDEILLALSLSALVGLAVAPWVGLAVGVVIVVIVACYRLNLLAYPTGGGDYEIARRNLGTRAGLVVAAALLVDYVLTLAVSLSVFSGYVAAMLPELKPYKVLVAVAGIALVTLLGLRGGRGSRLFVSVPAYLFIAAVLATIVVGAVRVLGGDVPEAATSGLEIAGEAGEDSALLGLATVFVVLRAFSSGSVALAGVQTVATAVPRFRSPRGRNAASTLLITGLLSATMLVGLTWLAAVVGVKYVADPATQLIDPAAQTARPGMQPAGSGGEPFVTHTDQDPVLGQLAQAVFSGFPFMFYCVAGIAALVLLVAANTAVEGFPGLASRLARDDFLPRQLAVRGDRMTFSNGILLLAGAAAALVVVFGASAPDLIELYLVGVFSAFVLGQIGMLEHWSSRIRVLVSSPLRMRMRLYRAVNGVGVVLAVTVLLVVLITKFTGGAWLAVAAIGLLFALMGLVHRHYGRVDAELAAGDDDVAVRALPSNTHAVVVVTDVHKPMLRALAYARATRPTSVTAITVAVDEEAAEELQAHWDAMRLPVPLTILDSPYRELVRPIMRYVTAIRRRSPRDLVIVYLPEYIVGRWWEQLLHNQTSMRLKMTLQHVPQVIVANVPWRLESVDRARESYLRRGGAIDPELFEPPSTGDPRSS